MKLSDLSGKQWRVLLILMLVNFVNHVDRQIVFSLCPSIRRDFALSYVQLVGTTGSVTLCSHAIGMTHPAPERWELRWHLRKLDVGVISQHTSLGKT